MSGTPVIVSYCTVTVPEGEGAEPMRLEKNTLNWCIYDFVCCMWIRELN